VVEPPKSKQIKLGFVAQGNTAQEVLRDFDRIRRVAETALKKTAEARTIEIRRNPAGRLWVSFPGKKASLLSADEKENPARALVNNFKTNFSRRKRNEGTKD
jgi:hypothetical protein